MPSIHPTAFISPKASIGDNVIIGPYCVVGDDVILENDVTLHSYVEITGKTSVGSGCKIFSYASLGAEPQDLSYNAEPTQLIIGKNCVIRENVIIHRATAKDTLFTHIGDNCYIMCNAHIGHDCIVKDKVVIGPNTVVGGHVYIGDETNISGLVAIHQYVNIGNNCMIGGGGTITRCVIPFAMTDSTGSHISGINLVGLKRKGLGKDIIKTIMSSIKDIQTSKKTLQELSTEFLEKNIDELSQIAKFIQNKYSRGYIRGKKND